MAKEIMINVHPGETRVAVLEKGKLVEFIQERTTDKPLVGGIFKAKVSGILPGMQAAFVDLGIGKHGFLFEDEILQAEGISPRWEKEMEEEQRPKRRRKRAKVSELLRKGEEILVQVFKEAIGTKGPCVTCYVSLPGRFMVLLPGVNHVGISRRITDQAERQRLKQIGWKIKPEKCGIIIRTASQGASEEELQAEAQELSAKWESVLAQSKEKQAPSFIYGEQSLPLRVVRDILTDQIKEVLVDDYQAYLEIVSLAEKISPKVRSLLKYYHDSEPIFDAYNLESEIEKALRRKVWLKSGGYLIFDHTEALEVIDVNTGKYTGKKSLEETVLKTNLEAAEEIPRQLRLRDLGGIIVIDFIDMEKAENRDKVMKALSDAVQSDKARINLLEISDLGLVQMTRKRVRPNLFQNMYENCSYCDGKGKLLSSTTLSLKVQRLMTKFCRLHKENKITVKVHPEIAKTVNQEAQGHIGELERETGARIEVVADPTLHWEDIVVLSDKGHVLETT